MYFTQTALGSCFATAEWGDGPDFAVDIILRKLYPAPTAWDLPCRIRKTVTIIFFDAITGAQHHLLSQSLSKRFANLLTVAPSPGSHHLTLHAGMVETGLPSRNSSTSRAISATNVLIMEVLDEASLANGRAPPLKCFCQQARATSSHSGTGCYLTGRHHFRGRAATSM